MSPRELAESEGKPIAIDWIEAALAALQDEPTGPLVTSALATNFSLAEGAPARQRADVIGAVIAAFRRSFAVIQKSRRTFRDATEAEAARWFSADDLPPAYAIFDDAIYFTPRFAPWNEATRSGFGLRCRAAMVLHESVHVFDPRSGEPRIHLSEWDEPAFSAQTLDESLSNPSAYASFAAQVDARALAWPREARWGAGRPAE